MNLSSQRFRGLELCLDACFRTDEAGSRLKVSAFVALEPELREATSHLGGIEQRVLNAERLRRIDGVFEEIDAMMMRVRAAREDEAAHLAQQTRARLLLQLAPD